LKNQTDAVNKLFIFSFKAVDSFGLSFSKKKKESNCVFICHSIDHNYIDPWPAAIDQQKGIAQSQRMSPS